MDLLPVFKNLKDPGDFCGDRQRIVHCEDIPDVLCDLFIEPAGILPVKAQGKNPEMSFLDVRGGVAAVQQQNGILFERDLSAVVVQNSPPFLNIIEQKTGIFTSLDDFVSDYRKCIRRGSDNSTYRVRQRKGSSDIPQTAVSGYLLACAA